MSEKKKFVVESLNTFYEIFIIEAENEEQAKKMSLDCEYNTSKWLGQQFVNVSDFDIKDLDKYSKNDPYFYEGYASIDNGCLSYKDFKTDDIIREMPITKLYKKALS